MWPFDILAKRRAAEEAEIKRIEKRTEEAREKAYQRIRDEGRRAREEVKMVRPSAKATESSGYGGFTDFSNPASPLNPVHQSTFYGSSSPSYDSCSSSSSSYDSGSSSSSDSGSSSSSCD